MKFDIALVSTNRERAYAKFKASATYTFAISNGPAKTHAEVIVADDSLEIIEEKGKTAKAAAKLALEKLLNAGRDPFEAPIFLCIPYLQAEYFSKFGTFQRKFPYLYLDIN
jgi:hypothetical protein